MRLNAINQFRENIESVRCEKRIMFGELAERAGISSRHLRRVINGEQDITMTKADRVADALGMTLVGLINWRDRKDG